MQLPICVNLKVIIDKEFVLCVSSKIVLVDDDRYCKFTLGFYCSLPNRSRLVVLFAATGLLKFMTSVPYLR